MKKSIDFFTEWQKKQDSQKMKMETHRIVI